MFAWALAAEKVDWGEWLVALAIFTVPLPWIFRMWLGLMAGIAERWPRRKSGAWLRVRMRLGVLAFFLSAIALSILILLIACAAYTTSEIARAKGLVSALLTLAGIVALLVWMSFKAWPKGRAKRWPAHLGETSPLAAGKQAQGTPVGIEWSNVSTTADRAPRLVQGDARQPPSTAKRWLAFSAGLAYFLLLLLIVFWGITFIPNETAAGYVGLAVLILFPVPLWVLTFRRMSRRSAQVESAGKALGLAFAHEDPFELTLRIPASLFGSHHPRAENVLWGEVETTKVWVFDLPVARGSGLDHVVGLCELGGGPYPRLRIGPPRPKPLDVDPSLAWKVLAFESEEFNQRFQVTTTDRAFGYKLVDARMMAWLLDLEPGWHFEVGAYQALCYRPVIRRVLAGPVDLSAIRTALTPYPEPSEVLGVALAFRRHVPRFVERLTV